MMYRHTEDGNMIAIASYLIHESDLKQIDQRHSYSEHHMEEQVHSVLIRRFPI